MSPQFSPSHAPKLLHPLYTLLQAKCTSFVEINFPEELWYTAHALYVKLRTISIKPSNKQIANEVASKLIAVVHVMENEYMESGGTQGYRTLPRAFRYFAVTAHESLGLFAELEATKESLKKAVIEFEHCRDIYKLIGIPTDIAHAEACIARAQSKYNGDNRWTAEDGLKDCRDYYKEACEESGEESPCALISLFRLADALKESYHGIESIRILTKLETIYRRIHGPDHDNTKEVEVTMRRYNKRHVSIRGWRKKQFQALRYISAENKYVVKGPIAMPRRIEDEKQFSVHAHEIRPTLGTPIMCHGLEGEREHLNGKIGDVRCRERGAQKYTLHFEDKSLEPCLVHPKNMRILFDLPSVEENTATSAGEDTSEE